MNDEEDSGPCLLSHRDIAKLWGCSRARVWQIEQRALAKLRRALLADHRDVDIDADDRRFAGAFLNLEP